VSTAAAPPVDAERKTRPVRDIQAPKQEVFMSCRTARGIAAGVARSTVPPEEWHAMCHGAYIKQEKVKGSKTGETREVIRRCACECHIDEHKCIDCKRTDTELKPFGVQCLDPAECAAYKQAKLEADPRYIKMMEAAREVSAIRAANREREAVTVDDDGEPIVREPRTPKVTNELGCHHCGETTKGGLFVAGHDMKLKGLLLRAARAGDANALAEFMERGWYKGKPEAHKLTPELVAAAEALDTNSSTWLAARVAERLARIEAGATPEEAVAA
jgi:hypothetical protein